MEMDGKKFPDKIINFDTYKVRQTCN